MTEWTKTQSDQITSLYGQLKGKYEKEAYKNLFSGPQLPYEAAHSTLLNLLKKQETEQKHGGLEQKAADTASSRLFGQKPAEAAVGLVAIIIALGALSAISVPAMGYKAAVYAASLY